MSLVTLYENWNKMYYDKFSGGFKLEEVLRVENISKKYQAKNGEVTALKNISFSINKGEFISIIGPSGCGKSTLLSIMAGLEERTSGEVYIERRKNRWNLI